MSEDNKCSYCKTEGLLTHKQYRCPKCFNEFIRNTDNNLYYNNEVVECEVLSCDYNSGDYYLEIRPESHEIMSIKNINDHDSIFKKLIFRGNYVHITYLKPNNLNFDIWNMVLHILPKVIIK